MEGDMAHICSRTIRGIIINPQSLMAVISHPLRKRVLNGLFKMALEKPITKKELAASLGIQYEKVNYQLNEHLSEFWRVVKKQKVRGAYREYIAPKNEHAVYVNLGSRKTLFVIDPFANLIGKLSDVGTRCDRCTPNYRKWCLEEISKQSCCRRGKSDLSKWDMLLRDNGRKPPFTPIDYLLVCTLATILDREECPLELGSCKCHRLR